MLRVQAIYRIVVTRLALKKLKETQRNFLILNFHIQINLIQNFPKWLNLWNSALGWLNTNKYMCKYMYKQKQERTCIFNERILAFDCISQQKVFAKNIFESTPFMSRDPRTKTGVPGSVCPWIPVYQDLLSVNDWKFIAIEWTQMIKSRRIVGRYQNLAGFWQGRILHKTKIFE